MTARTVIPSPANTLTAHCAECAHEWSQPLRLPMALDRFAAFLEGVAAAGCPACGAHGDAVLCGPRSNTTQGAGKASDRAHTPTKAGSIPAPVPTLGGRA